MNNALVEFQRPSGDWVNISEYRYNRDPIGITYGRSDGDNATPPAQCTFTLNNKSGMFSPRNPNSPLYGLLKRNTPVRVSKGLSAYGMVLSGVDASTGRASMVDTAAVSITGDQDIRIDLETLAAAPTNGAGAQSGVTSSWTAGSWDIASKFDDTNAARSWTVINILGNIRYNWFALGTVASQRQATSTVTVPAPAQGRRAIRITHDVDNGAGGTTVTFYTGPTLAGPWTPLGAPVTSAGTTTVFDGTANLRVGGNPTGSLYTYMEGPSSTFYGFELRNGINGAVVASCDFTALPLDPDPISSSNFTDAQGNVWGFGGANDSARVWWGVSAMRFNGEISSIPPKWDASHSDKYVPITASGPDRRMQQGKNPVNTALRDFVLKDQTALLSYFPLDGQEGTQYSRNIANTNKNTLNFFNEALPTKPTFKYGVDMGAGWIGSGMELERALTPSSMRGDTASWDSNIAFDFVWQSPALGALSVSLFDYNGQIWTLDLNDISDSGLGQVSFTDPAVGPIGFATFAVPEINDTDLHIGRLQITNNGANIDYAVYVDGTVRKTGTQAGYNTNGAAVFRINYNHANTGQVAVNLAHLITWANAVAAAIPTAAAVAAAALGYAGEAAGRRIQRVCSDGAIPIEFVGDLDKTTRMGVQFAEPRFAQIRDAEATDLGILASSRVANRLWYRTRASLYAQTPALVLDYSARVVAPPFEPVDDDTNTRNVITASRRDGGSYQISKLTGPLAATDPPVGIGQYEDEITVNVETDAQLAGHAAWFLNWGTLDAARYPSLVVDLQALEGELGSVAADALIDDVLTAFLGDRVQVTNLEAADITEDLDLMLLGYNEQITNKTWLWSANCGPYELYRTAKFGTDKFDAIDCVLTSSINAAVTTFTVNTPRTIWTRSQSFDVNIGGERMTVASVTGTGTTQTFASVTRGVNGVATAHTAGETVRLWDGPRFAL